MGKNNIRRISKKGDDNILRFQLAVSLFYFSIGGYIVIARH